MVRRHSPVRALRASTDGALVGRAPTRRRKTARLPYCSNLTGPAPGRHREPRPKRAGRRTRSCRSSSSSAASTRKPALRTAQSRRRAPISAKRDQLVVQDADPRSTGPVTERVSRRSSVARWSPRRRRLVAAADSCGSRDEAGMGSVGDLELVEDSRDVVADRLLAQEQRRMVKPTVRDSAALGAAPRWRNKARQIRRDAR
jgi:hypothetical protein